MTLAVTNTVTPLGVGSTAGTLENSFTEVAVPEASTWAMLALGFGGLELAGFSRRKLSISALS